MAVDETFQIDFINFDSFEYTKPVSFSYFEDEFKNMNTWSQLYSMVCACLLEDYPNVLNKMRGTNVSDGQCIDFGNEEASKQMRRPKKISDNFYVESNLSAVKIVTKIRNLLDLCNVDYENLAIYYKKQNSHKKEGTSSALIGKNHDDNDYIEKVKKAEEYLIQRNLDGTTSDELMRELDFTVSDIKEYITQSTHVIEMNKRLYHKDALVDLNEGADSLEIIIDGLLNKYNGAITAKLLFEYSRSEMAMFLNDNDISDQQSVYDLARYLFEKLNYHGKRYAFSSNKLISRRDIEVNSVGELVQNYALNKGSIITFKEIQDYLTDLRLNTDNVRALMKIDREPIFFVYNENEYLLAELIHVDDNFLKSICFALNKLFSDTDGYVIPRNISDSWYKLLPTLPASLQWTPMLLQQLIQFFPNKLEARSIIAMKSQNSNTLHAAFVENKSWIQDFQDVVAVFLHDQIPDRNEFEAEELRKILLDLGMISGNQLIYKMPVALGNDPRFLWNSDGSRVKVRLS